MLRYSLITLNSLIVIALLLLLFNEGSGPSINPDSNNLLASANTSESTVNPLDSLSSAEIAATAAQLARLPETTAIVNQADSDEAQLHMITTGNNVLSKPQVVTSNYYSNKDIKEYVVEDGDTLASVAKKFDLSQDTLKWSNSLTSTSLTKGQKLLIPPVNGIVYMVKKGDTANSLANRYSADEAKIIAYNDAELKGLKVGERIIIPGGEKPQPTYFTGYSGYSWGYSAQYGYNGYDYGYCTWYVANRISMPANWGNASSWAYYASRTPGWTVSSIPTVGSIAQRTWGYGGAGHVAIVDAVNGDMVKITDMNGVAGWGVVGTAWVPVSQFNHFLTH